MTNRVHVFYVMAMWLLFIFFTFHPLQSQAASKSGYSKLIYSIFCPQEKLKNLNSIGDLGYKSFKPEASLCGEKNVPSGYVVYHFPNWKIYKNYAHIVDSTLKKRATANYRYRHLVTIIRCQKDTSLFGKHTPYYNLGFRKKIKICTKSITRKGYWVYANSHWYQWRYMTKKYKREWSLHISKTYKKYKGRVHCKKSKKKIGRYFEAGFYIETRRYCGKKLKGSSYHIYSNGWWLAYGKRQFTNHDKIAQIDSKYRYLIKKKYAPHLKNTYKLFEETNYSASHYLKSRVRPGYWIYYKSHWYIWLKKELSSIHFKTLTTTFKRKTGKILTLKFDYYKTHKKWAAEILAIVKSGLKYLEKLTGTLPISDSTYLISERLSLNELGNANSTRMILSPKASPWVALHETVHIWNAGVSPTWICEGGAEYLSFLMILKFKKAIRPAEKKLFKSLLTKNWSKIKKVHLSDKPLAQFKSGFSARFYIKSQKFWLMLHSLYGKNMVFSFFKESLRLEKKKKSMSLKHFRIFLFKHMNVSKVYKRLKSLSKKKYKSSKILKIALRYVKKIKGKYRKRYLKQLYYRIFISGWLTKGIYFVQKSKDLRT